MQPKSDTHSEGEERPKKELSDFKIGDEASRSFSRGSKVVRGRGRGRWGRRGRGRWTHRSYRKRLLQKANNSESESNEGSESGDEEESE